MELRNKDFYIVFYKAKNFLKSICTVQIVLLNSTRSFLPPLTAKLETLKHQKGSWKTDGWLDSFTCIPGHQIHYLPRRTC